MIWLFWGWASVPTAPREYPSTLRVAVVSADTAASLAPDRTRLVAAGDADPNLTRLVEL